MPQLSAGMVIGRRENGRLLFLLLRAYRNWDFPKGEVEEGEEPFEAARREVREETGISELGFPRGRIFQETEPYRNGRKVARYYLAETEEAEVCFAVNPELGRPEHHEYRWLTAVEARKLIPARLNPIIAWAEAQLEETVGD